MTSKSIYLLAGLAVMSAAAVGCGPPRAQVRGTVTLDGKPVANGSIQFTPADPNAGPVGVGITDGKYEADAPVGKMTVSINASEVASRQKAYDAPDAPMNEVMRSIVPARYNTDTELTADLVSGPNEKNFELVGGKKGDGKK